MTLSDIRPAQARFVGGKAARLAALLQLGFAVPVGFCIPTLWYERWLASGGSSSRDAAPLPAGLEDEIARFCERLSNGDGDARWAVRSSATAEDGCAASWAGQGDSFLDVPTPEVPARVRDCWLSLRSPHALAYRQRVGGEAAMAVVVQRMLSPQVSGIAFSRDPITGRREVVVEAVPGTGDGLARGDLSPVRYVVPADGDGRLAESSQDGLLSAADLAKVGGLARGAEASLGWPVDVEWALAEGRVFILQARPLTACGGDSFYTTVADDDELWTAGFVNERFPTPVSPLGWTVVRDHFERLALREPLAYIGHPEAWRRPVTRLRHGHPYVAVEAAASLYKLLPDALLPDDAARFFPQGRTELRRHAAYPRSWLDARLWWAILRTLVREAANVSPFHNDRVWARCRRRYGSALDEVAPALAAADTPGLLALAERVQAANGALLAVHRWSLTHADLWYTLLRRLARAWLGEAWQQAVARLVRGADVVSVALDAELRELAVPVGERSALRAAVAAARDLADLTSRLEANDADRAWLARLRDFLARYGHRSYSLDIHQPGFAAAPRQVFDLLLVLSREQCGEAVAKDELAGEHSGHAIRKLAWWKRLAFGGVLGLARRYLRLREEQRFHWQRGLALLRQIYVALGARLAEQGRLSAADDVFFLTVEEVGAAARGDRPPAETARLAARRRREFAALAAEQQAAPEAAYPPFLRGATPLGLAAGDGRQTLRGTPVSSGLAVGTVRVVRDPSGLAEVQPGEVLVAPSVDPGWTPVFGKLAALVTECGGQLSHPAVVAREYGLPAVLAVPGATQRLRSGDRVVVDGAAGTVVATRAAGRAGFAGPT